MFSLGKSSKENAWIGLILILTGAFGICPIYALLGINTKTVGEKLGSK